jgi:hypothetical protein
LIGHSDEFLGQLLEVLVVGHEGFDLRGLSGGDSFGELLSMQVALENKIGSLPAFGSRIPRAKELATEGAAAKVVDAGHIPEDLFPAFLELRER